MMSIASLSQQVAGLNLELTGVISNAESAIKISEQAATETRGGIAALEKSVTATEAANTAIRGAQEAVEGSSEQLRSIADQSSKTTETVMNNLQQTQKSIESSSGDIQKILETLEGKSGNILERLLAAVLRFETDFNPRIEEALEAVRIGGLSIERFLLEFGDFVIDFEGEMKTFQQIFQGADLAGIQSDIEELRRKLREEVGTIEQIFSVLEGIQNKAAQDLLKVLKLLVAGQGTAQDLADALERARDFFPGEGDVLNQVVDVIEETLRDDQKR